MPVIEGSRVDFVLKRIPLDVEYGCPISASQATDDEDAQGSGGLVSVSVFHAAVDGSAEDGDLRTAPPQFFEVHVGEPRSAYFDVGAAVHAMRNALDLDADEATDIERMLMHTTNKRHSKSHSLTRFKLDKKHWEWCYETQGEIEPTANEGLGLLVHATVWNDTTLSLGETPADCEFGEDALDPFDEDEFAGVRHRSAIP